MAMRLNRMLMSLLREFVCGEMVSLAMRCRGSLVSMCGKVMQFGDTFVRTLRHLHSPVALDAKSGAAAKIHLVAKAQEPAPPIPSAFRPAQFDNTLA
jgi:hypothetical protein